MIDEIFEFIAKVILQIIFQIILWILFTPLFFIVATPLILFIALFKEGDYQENIALYYTKSFALWKECILLFPDFFE